MTAPTLLVDLLVRAQTATPSPTSTDDVLRPDLNPYDVSPGLIGFLAIFALAVVSILGWMSMNRRVRRMKFQEREHAAAAAQAEAQEVEHPEARARSASSSALTGQGEAQGTGQGTPSPTARPEGAAGSAPDDGAPDRAV